MYTHTHTDMQGNIIMTCRVWIYTFMLQQNAHCAFKRKKKSHWCTVSQDWPENHKYMQFHLNGCRQRKRKFLDFNTLPNTRAHLRTKKSERWHCDKVYMVCVYSIHQNSSISSMFTVVFSMPLVGHKTLILWRCLLIVLGVQIFRV